MNPEFRRNLWLELPAHRVVAIPAVLVLVFLAAWLAGGESAVAPISLLTTGLLLIIWGSRLAADSVLSEVVARTWDNQRMSAIGPWDMTWGKLFGSTIYVWYGASWCAFAFLVIGDGRPVDLARLLLSGLEAQALALLVSLLLLRRGSETVGFQVTVAQVGAILAVLPIQTLLQIDPEGYVSWYGYVIGQARFILATQLALLAWTVLGAYRVMRAELQYNAGQVTWVGFVVFLAAYVAGFDGLLMLGGDTRLPGLVAARLFFAFCVAVALTYIAAFVEPKSLVRLRRWVGFARQGRVDRVAEMVPTWLTSGAIALILAIATIINLYLIGHPGLDPLADVGPLILAVVLFAVRDVSMLYYLILQERARRAHLAALVYLLFLYFLAPVMLSAADLEALTPVFVPTPTGPWPLIVLPVATQALVAFLLAMRRWRIVRATDFDRQGFADYP